jgi:hypothetical protein
MHMYSNESFQELFFLTNHQKMPRKIAKKRGKTRKNRTKHRPMDGNGLDLRT